MLRCLQFSACAAKVVKINVEPVVHALVLFVILGADLLACQALLERLGLCGRAVLVRAAQVQRVDLFHAAKSKA